MAKPRQIPASDASPPARRCAIYTRQSRNRRVVFSSCEVQRGICSDFAAESRWQISDQRFDDAGESSETLDRPALQRLLDQIETGGVDRVIIYSVDRLTRKLFDLHRLLEFFEQHGVILNVVTDPHFGRSAGDRLMTNIVAAASEFQQDLTRERMAEARAALKQKGRRVAGRVPYGYVTDAETKQLVVNRKEATRVRKIFELAASGNRPKEIADIANKRRWRTRSNGNGGLWTSRQILKALSNPTYAGLIRNGSDTLPGQHEAIVVPELFEKVRQDIESRRSRKPGRKPSQVLSPLRGILKCGRCGRAMIPSISQHKNIRYRYYRCRSTAGGKPPCRGVGLPAYEIEEFVRSMLGSIDSIELASVKSESCEQFTSAWQTLDDWTQRTRLHLVMSEVVFDPDEESIEVTLADDAINHVGPQS